MAFTATITITPFKFHRPFTAVHHNLSVSQHNCHRPINFSRRLLCPFLQRSTIRPFPIRTIPHSPRSHNWTISTITHSLPFNSLLYLPRLPVPIHPLSSITRMSTVTLDLTQWRLWCLMLCWLYPFRFNGSSIQDLMEFGGKMVMMSHNAIFVLVVVCFVYSTVLGFGTNSEITLCCRCDW